MSDQQRPRYPEYPGEAGPSQDGSDIGSWNHYEPGAMLQQPRPVVPPPHREPPAADVVARSAGWWHRFAAHLVDSVLTLVLGLPLVVVGAIRWFEDAEWPDTQDSPTGLDPTGYAMFMAGLVLLVAIQVVHAVVLQSRTGWTVGKKLLGLRLVRDDGSPVSVKAALGRWAAWVMILIVPFAVLLDVLWPLWDSQKQTLHDQMAHTLVVHA